MGKDKKSQQFHFSCEKFLAMDVLLFLHALKLSTVRRILGMQIVLINISTRAHGNYAKSFFVFKKLETRRISRKCISVAKGT